MHISIDTSTPLSEKDRTLLVVLIGDELVEGGSEPAPAEEVAKPAPKAEPAKAKPKGAAKKAAQAAKKPEPEPEPEPEEEEEPEEAPEPMAEEPVEEEPEQDEEQDDEEDDESLLKMAVKKATDMVAGGDAAKVREALDAAGASRVRELNKDNVRDFFKALS